MAPHSHVFSQILQVLHSAQRLMLKTVVAFEMTPRNAPTGQRKRQYRFLTNTVARRSVPRPTHMIVEPCPLNIQNG